MWFWLAACDQLTWCRCWKRHHTNVSVTSGDRHVHGVCHRCSPVKSCFLKSVSGLLGDPERTSLLLVAPGGSAHRSALSAVCPFHDQPERTAGEDPANPHVSAEHPQHLELPLAHPDLLQGGLKTEQPWTKKKVCQLPRCHPPASLSGFDVCRKDPEDQSKAEMVLSSEILKQMFPDHLRNPSTCDLFLLAAKRAQAPNI